MFKEGLFYSQYVVAPALLVFHCDSTSWTCEDLYVNSQVVDTICYRTTLKQPTCKIQIHKPLRLVLSNNLTFIRVT